jgi:hypothetical protein
MVKFTPLTTSFRPNLLCRFITARLLKCWIEALANKPVGLVRGGGIGWGEIRDLILCVSSAGRGMLNFMVLVF